MSIPIEKSNYSFSFFILGSLCFVISLWAWQDELFDRRPWKTFQRLYYQISYDKAEKEYDELSKSVDEKREKLTKKINVLSIRLNGNSEYKALQKKLTKVNYKLGDVQKKVKFAKSRLDEAYYFYKHALHEQEEWEHKKEIVDDIQKEIDSYKPETVSLKQESDETKAILESFSVEKDKLKKKLQSLNEDIERIQQKMGGFKKSFFFFDFFKIPEVTQVVIKGFNVNNFGEPILRVDRCMSCHVSYNNPEFANEEQPLKTHPNLATLIKKHPTVKFGCTLCHKGQGVGLSSVWQAHGNVHHERDKSIGENEPLLEGDFLQSNCRMCHDDTLELEDAPVLSKGKRLFLKLGCHGCHLARGYENLGKVAPSLKKVASKVNPSWLFRWVKRPKDYLVRTKMPDFELSDKDAEAIVAYLMKQSDDDYKMTYDFNPGLDVEKGRQLFEDMGCLGCHTIDGNGKTMAPDLSRIASKVNGAWIYNWLLNPKQYDPATIMPNFRLSEIEAGQIATYLMTLGKRKEIDGIAEKIKSPELIAYGEKVIKRRGCFACHEINGMENEGRIAPELTTFGVKRLLELEFGDSKIDKTWESWARKKLKDPAAFRTERILDQMPNFNLSKDEINAIVVFLKSFNGARVPKEYKHYSERTNYLEEGLQLIRKYNCRGCHIIDGVGGKLAPLLDFEGARVQTKFLLDFLIKPHKLRSSEVFSARMPTFGFTHDEAVKLVHYFKTLSNVPFVDEFVDIFFPQEMIDEGEKIFKEVYICITCHMVKGEGERFGPELTYVYNRINYKWASKWIKDPEHLNPDSQMPTLGLSDEEVKKVLAFIYNPKK